MTFSCSFFWGKFFHLGICIGLVFFSVLGKTIMFSAPESNGFINWGSYWRAFPVCLGLSQCVLSFNYVCFGLLVKSGQILFPLELKLCSTLWSMGLVHAGSLCWSSQGGAHSCSGPQAQLPWLKSTKKYLQNAVGGAWCKWLKPHLWVLCCSSLISIHADGWGIKNVINPLCHLWRGELALVVRKPS